jgi:hypothetical protein
MSDECRGSSAVRLDKSAINRAISAGSAGDL